MNDNESAARRPDERLVHRMLFFSDAVFAIVLTLLALELRPPDMEGPDHALWPALAGMAEHFLAFAMSFALVGLWWIVHMRVTRQLIAFDWLCAICNLLVLACITVIPFATAVFGESVSSLAALQFYFWVSAAAAFSMTLMFLVTARDKGRLIGGIDRGEWWFRFTQAVAPGIAFIAGIYFCATGQVWLARFAALFMLPLMLIGRLLFYRTPKASQARG
jgi:uncharacterized membrane protein